MKTGLSPIYFLFDLHNFQAHDGPGVQHIGLAVQNLIETAQYLRHHLDFIHPPDAYYCDTQKISEIAASGIDVEQMRQLGILLDSEADIGDGQGCLMQLFSQPLFSPQESFFLELLERRGARGFGAGNIKALWRAVEAYMLQKETAKASSACNS